MFCFLGNIGCFKLWSPFMNQYWLLRGVSVRSPSRQERCCPMDTPCPTASVASWIGSPRAGETWGQARGVWAAPLFSDRNTRKQWRSHARIFFFPSVETMCARTTHKNTFIMVLRLMRDYLNFSYLIKYRAYLLKLTRVHSSRDLPYTTVPIAPNTIFYN